MIKSKYIFYGIVAIAVIGAVFVSAFTQPHMGGTKQSFIGGFIQSDVTNSDFELSASWDNEINNRISFDDDNKIFHSWYSLKIASDRDDLFYRVYDKSASQELTSSARIVGISGFSNAYTDDAKLKTIDQSKEIEVCV